MNWRKPLIIAAVYCAAFVALCAYAGTVLAAPTHSRAACGAEDSSSWVWSACGNHKRGVTTARGAHVVVGPCRFARLRDAGALDRARTPRLRGDWHARCPESIY